MRSCQQQSDRLKGPFSGKKAVRNVRGRIWGGRKRVCCVYAAGGMRTTIARVLVRARAVERMCRSLRECLGMSGVWSEEGWSLRVEWWCVLL